MGDGFINLSRVFDNLPLETLKTDLTIEVEIFMKFLDIFEMRA
jgi:hypothetical protein